jgi:hypothetical protein
MTTNEMISAILSQFPGSAMVRNEKAKANFIAVPKGENEDGVMEYASIKVGSLLSKDTKSNTAFNFNEAVAAYEAYVAGVAEKAAKPKAEKKSNANPEKVAAANARKEAALAWLIENSGEHTATDVKAAIDPDNKVTIMQIGSDLKSLMQDGQIVCEKREGKNYWSFVG